MVLAHSFAGTERVAGKLLSIGQQIVAPGKTAGNTERSNGLQDDLQLPFQIIAGFSGNKGGIQFPFIVVHGAANYILSMGVDVSR